MRVAILSDAHANNVSLNQCIQKIATLKVEKVFFLGDAVGYFSEPEKVLDSLESIGAISLLGNHEAMVLGYLKYNPEKNQQYKLDDHRIRMGLRYLKLLENRLPFTFVKIDKKKLLFVHGSPWDPLNGYIYPDNNKLEQLCKLGFNAIFMGHTHWPFIYQQNNICVINPGSCGLPRDCGQLPSFALYDTITEECEIIRVQSCIDDILKANPTIHTKIIECLMRTSNGKPVGSLLL
jgi:putative phosphoesterase